MTKAKSAKPTQGMWRWHTQSHGTAIQGEDGESIAWCGANWSSLHGAIPHVANARLMVAAPELLAALEQIQQANGCFDGCRGPADRNHVRTCQDARSAIAKARGE